MPRALACIRNFSVSRASVATLEASIVNTFSEGTVSSKVRLARLLWKIRKKISAPSACAWRMAGSTMMALPISESSMNSSLRAGAGAPPVIRRIRSASATNGLARAQSGTPTQWSMARMVSTLRLIVPAF